MITVNSLDAFTIHCKLLQPLNIFDFVGSLIHLF